MFKPPPPPIPPRVWSKEPINEQKQSAFLTRLPAEIRNEIYRYVFGNSAGLDGESDYNKPSKSPSSQPSISIQGNTCTDSTRTPNHPTNPPNTKSGIKSPSPLSLLQTCRLINTEATLLAFSTHTFPLHRPIPSYHHLLTLTSPLSPA
ncbi:hypothetical protein K458DRAFT_381274 [Lentithecium fluviatile CBS 122367]|uniref:DUF7730 domain-containing protein n=1 Tax=Lentithecium fluviatile CBS 122367 TaxID=1168545 RepID=A0A6G1JLH0_9PLEO|nr:hypothetical protein K458DRAFT_381274 [Lentithecium fluviatile CBS 122367]